jgi:hypothetical protein
VAYGIHNLDNIRVNWWSDSKIVHITREQNTEIGWTSDSEQGDIRLAVFPKLCTTIDYDSLKRHSLGSMHGSGEKQSQR